MRWFIVGFLVLSFLAATPSLASDKPIATFVDMKFSKSAVDEMREYKTRGGSRPVVVRERVVIGWRWRLEMTLEVHEPTPVQGWQYAVTCPLLDGLARSSENVKGWFTVQPLRGGEMKVAVEGYAPYSSIASYPKWKLLQGFEFKSWATGSSGPVDDSKADDPFVRTGNIAWHTTLEGNRLLRWTLVLEIQKRPVGREVQWDFSGPWLDFLVKNSRDLSPWKVVSHAEDRATFRASGLHESDSVAGLLSLSELKWAKDIQVVATPLGSVPRPVQKPTPKAVAPSPARQQPVAASSAQGRETHADSLALIQTWESEKREMDARIARIEAALRTVDAQAEKYQTARGLLTQVREWMQDVDARTARAVADVREGGLGVLLEDRVRINTAHFKSHRRLESVEDVLVGVLHQAH